MLNHIAGKLFQSGDITWLRKKVRALQKIKRNKGPNREKVGVTQHFDAGVSMSVELAGMW